MTPPALLALSVNPLFWVVPLALGISFAYTASRYEDRAVILRRSFSFFWKTLLALFLIFGALWLLSAPL